MISELLQKEDERLEETECIFRKRERITMLYG